MRLCLADRLSPMRDHAHHHRETRLPWAGSWNTVSGVSRYSHAIIALLVFLVESAFPGGLWAAATEIRAAIGLPTSTLVVADFNADGAPDIVVTNAGLSQLTVFLNDGRGHFIETSGKRYPVWGLPVSAITADLNRDGKADLVVADQNRRIVVLLGDGTGELKSPNDVPAQAAAPAAAMAVADFNHDGLPDLVLVDTSCHVAVWLGNGVGGFSNSSNTAPSFGSGATGLVIGDFNRDGNEDVAVDTDLGISVCWGDGFGNLEARADGPYPLGCTGGLIATADINADSLPDLVTTCADRAVGVISLRNEAGGWTTLELPLPFKPVALAIADMDGDGIQDIVIANQDDGVFVLWGDSAGKFVSNAASMFRAGVLPYMMAVADINMDGKPDVIVVGRDASRIAPIVNELPTLTADRPTLHFNYAGSQWKTHSARVVISAGPGPYAVLTAASSHPWLTITPVVSPIARTSLLDITLNTADLQPGYHETRVRVTAPGYFGTYIVVTLQVGEPPAISVNTLGPNSVTDNAGQMPQAITTEPLRQRVTISSTVAVNADDLADFASGSQSILFPQPPNVPLPAGRLMLLGSSSAGLPVTFLSLTPTVCSILADQYTLVSDGVVLLNHPGVCWIVASQNGGYAIRLTTTTPESCAVGSQTPDPSFVSLTFSVSLMADTPDCYLNSTVTAYQSAASVARSFLVLPDTSSLEQTVAHSSMAMLAFGQTPFQLSAAATSGLPVRFSSTTPGVCSVDGSLMTTTGEGLCTLVASQAGNAAWAPASVLQHFVVSGIPTGAVIPSGTAKVGKAPVAVAAADFNGDGRQDLVVVNRQDNNVSVLMGDGAGGFTGANSVPTGHDPVAVVIGDFNEDRQWDLAVVNQGSKDVSILLGDGRGGFSASLGTPPPLGETPVSIVLGDFNGDGHLDLAIANQSSQTVTVLLGDGTGGFVPSPSSPFSIGMPPSAMVTGDFGGAGRFDLAITSQSGNALTVLLSDGAGGFAASPNGPTHLGMSPSALVVGDFNNDGALDLAVADTASSTVAILNGDTQGGFAMASGNPHLVVSPAPAALLAADFNGDGQFDIAAVNQGTNDLTVLLGDGPGSFSAASGGPIPLGNSPSAMAVADFNSDGRIDLALLDGSAGVVTTLLGSAIPTRATLSTSTPLPVSVGATVELLLAVSVPTGSFSPPSGVATLSDNGTIIATAAQRTTPYAFTIKSRPGSHAYTAHLVGDVTTAPTTSAPLVIELAKVAQTITFPPLPNATFGANTSPFVATASSGLPVTVSANPDTVCTLTGNVVTPRGTGNCSLTASQAGDSDYTAAAPVTVTFAILPATQTITFGAVSNQPYGIAPFPITTSASSGLPVTLSAGPATVCTVVLNLVNTTGLGTCVIVGHQSGNANYTPAPEVTLSFQVVAAVDLAITVTHEGNFGKKQVGAEFVITVRNVGSVPSTGAVTVVDTLPASVTVTRMDGPGWNCNTTGLTCSRSDALQPGGSYPITITFNVPADLLSLTNVATVSCSGESNVGNNISSDVAALSSVRTIAVTPASGAGASQTFAFSVGDSSGYENLSSMMVLITSTASQANSCMIMYNVATDTVSLADDSGASFTYAMTLSGAASIQNSQCTVSALGASVNGFGDVLNVTLPISFHQSFAGAGAKSVLLYARDSAGAATGWDLRGSWSVPTGLPVEGQAGPSTVSVVPASGSGTSQTFTFTVADTAGYQNLFGMMVLITSGATAANACMIRYDTATNTVRLADGTGYIFPYSLTLPTSKTIQNDQCALSGAGASVRHSATSLVFTLPITFLRSFTGTKSISLYTRDSGGIAAGWDVRGSWVVPD